jgi:hypothetical protein
MKSILINVLIAFILILSMGSTLALAQDNASPAPKDQPVDESTVIFAGCRLSVLVKQKPTDPTIALTPEQIKGTATNIVVGQKQKYIQGCIQEIIRFIIVIASLAAILKIAASGIAMMDPTGSKMSSKLTSRSTITNLVIGLFLLIVGWNLIPILNQSFNNVDFLNLPGVNYCAADQACISEYSTQANESKKAFETYLAAEKDKKISLSDKYKKELLDGIQKYCDNKDKALYKEAFTAAKVNNDVNNKICTEKKYTANIDLWMKNGKSDKGGAPLEDFDKITTAYATAVNEYKTLTKKDGTAQGDTDKAAAAITASCSAENIKTLEEVQSKITDEKQKTLSTGIINNCKILIGTDKAAIRAKLAELAK